MFISYPHSKERGIFDGIFKFYDDYGNCIIYFILVI